MPKDIDDTHRVHNEGGKFDLLCVAPEFYFSRGKAGKNGNKTSRMVEDYDHRTRAEARQHLKRAQTMLAAHDVEAVMRLESGSPSRVITRLAAEYDVTVVGAHDQYTRSKPGLGPVASRVVAGATGAVLIGREFGEEDLKHDLLGSVSTKVTQAAPCSTLVVKASE